MVLFRPSRIYYVMMLLQLLLSWGLQLRLGVHLLLRLSLSLLVLVLLSACLRLHHHLFVLMGIPLRLDVGMVIMWLLLLLFQVGVVRLRLQADVLLPIFAHITSSRIIQLLIYPLRVILNRYTMFLLHALSMILILADMMIAIDSQLPSLLLILALLMLTHIQRLLILSRQLLLCPQLISNCLVDPRAASRAFNIRGVQTTHCLLYTSPSPRDRQKSRMPSSA